MCFIEDKDFLKLELKNNKNKFYLKIYLFPLLFQICSLLSSYRDQINYFCRGYVDQEFSILCFRNRFYTFTLLARSLSFCYWKSKRLKKI